MILSTLLKSSVLAVARLGSAGVNILLFAVAARELEPSDFGQLSLLLAMLAVAMVVVDGGLPFLVSDAVARGVPNPIRFYRAVLRRRMTLAAVAAAGLVGAYAAVVGGQGVAASAVAAMSLPGMAVYTTANAALRGVGHVRPEALNEIVSRVIVVAASITWLRAGGGVIEVVAVYSSANAVSALVLHASARRRLAPDNGQPTVEVSRRTGGALFAGRLGYALVARLDVWMLALLFSPVAVAGYAAAYRVLDVFELGARTVGAMSFQTDRGANAVVRNAVALATIVATLVALGALALALFAPGLMELLFGPEYRSQARVLRVLLCAAPFLAFSSVLIPIVSVRRSSFFAGAVVAAVALTAGLNAVAIPQWQAMGAAVVTVVMSVIGALVLMCVALGLARQTEVSLDPQAPI